MRVRRLGLIPVCLSWLSLSGAVLAGVDPAALALLPAEAHVLCAAPSLDALENAEMRLCERLGTEAYGEEDLRDLFAESPLGTLMAHADMGGPLVATMSLPMPGLGSAPTFTMVFRTDLAPADAASIAAAFDSSPDLSVRCGGEGWVAVSSDPAYAPRGIDAARMLDLPTGDLGLRLDFRALFEDYGALISMGLDMAEAAAAAEADGDAAAAQSGSPETIAAMKPLVQALVASLDRFDLGLDVAGETVALRTRLGMRAGSPLAPGPQPDFARARALTRALAHDADATQVGAFDVSRILDIYKPLWRVAFRENASQAGIDSTLVDAWLDGYYDLLDLARLPMATTAEFDGEGLSTVTISETPDAAAALERIAAFMDESTAVYPGLSYTSLPARTLSGTTVRVWSLAFDAEAMASPILKETGSGGTPTPGAMLALLPGHLSLAARGDRLLCAWSDDPDALAAPLERLRAGGGHVDTRIDRVARKGEPDTRQVVIMDLKAYLTWIAGLIPEHGADISDALAQVSPIRIPLSVSTSDTYCASRCELEMWEIAALYRALRVLDKD